jgi:hypothetical protein
VTQFVETQQVHVVTISRTLKSTKIDVLGAKFGLEYFMQLHHLNVILNVKSPSPLQIKIIQNGFAEFVSFE